MAKQEKEKKTIDSVLQSINKRYGEGTLMALGSNQKAFVKTITTGSMAIDDALGGGYAVGRLVELFSEPSVGKSTISATAIAEVQKTGGRAAYIDTENSVDAKYFEALGVNIKELLFTQPDSAEAACQILLDLLDTGEFSLIVVDSIAAMIPQKIFEADAGEATMAVLARILSQEMPKIASKAMDSNCTVIFTNQVRNMIGGYGGGITTPGGQAMKFYASQRIHLFKGTSAEDHGEKVGNNSWCRVIKNKIAPPMREAKFTIKFGKGLDRMQELLDYAVNYGIIQKGGSWYSYGDVKLGQGASNVVSLLEDNPELEEEIRNKVNEERNKQHSEVEVQEF